METSVISITIIVYTHWNHSESLVILIAIFSPFVKIYLPLILIFTIIHLKKKRGGGTADSLMK